MKKQYSQEEINVFISENIDEKLKKYVYNRVSLTGKRYGSYLIRSIIETDNLYILKLYFEEDLNSNFRNIFAIDKEGNFKWQIQKIECDGCSEDNYRSINDHKALYINDKNGLETYTWFGVNFSLSEEDGKTESKGYIRAW